MEILPIILAIAFLVLVGLFLFFAEVKIVNQYERLLVFTLGRTSPEEVKGPGWVFVVPTFHSRFRSERPCMNPATRCSASSLGMWVSSARARAMSRSIVFLVVEK